MISPCPRCGSSRVVTAPGENRCETCGHKWSVPSDDMTHRGSVRGNRFGSRCVSLLLLTWIWNIENGGGCLFRSYPAPIYLVESRSVTVTGHYTDADGDVLPIYSVGPWVQEYRGPAVQMVDPMPSPPRDGIAFLRATAQNGDGTVTPTECPIWLSWSSVFDHTTLSAAVRLDALPSVAPSPHGIEVADRSR